MNWLVELSQRNKWVCYMLIFSIFFTQTRCTSYRVAAIQQSEVSQNGYLAANVSKYRILVNDGVKTYELKSPSISGDQFAGELLPISSADYNKLLNTSNYKERRTNKNCIFISTNHELLPLSAAIGEGNLSSKASIRFNEITKINGYIVDGSESVLRTLLIIGIVLTVFFFVVILLTLKSAADNGSNSNSNSGDSGSGASGEGSNGSGDASGKSSGG